MDGVGTRRVVVRAHGEGTAEYDLLEAVPGAVARHGDASAFAGDGESLFGVAKVVFQEYLELGWRSDFHDGRAVPQAGGEREHPIGHDEGARHERLKEAVVVFPPVPLRDDDDFGAEEGINVGGRHAPPASAGGLTGQSDEDGTAGAVAKVPHQPAYSRPELALDRPDTRPRTVRIEGPQVRHVGGAVEPLQRVGKAEVAVPEGVVQVLDGVRAHDERCGQVRAPGRVQVGRAPLVNPPPGGVEFAKSGDAPLGVADPLLAEGTLDLRALLLRGIIGPVHDEDGPTRREAASAPEFLGADDMLPESLAPMKPSEGVAGVTDPGYTRVQIERIVRPHQQRTLVKSVGLDVERFGGVRSVLPQWPHHDGDGRGCHRVAVARPSLKSEQLR